MLKCVNCDKPAKYDVENGNVENQLYCADDLPAFINLKHDYGMRVLPVVQPVEKPMENAVEKPVVSKSQTKKASITKAAELAEVEILVVSEKSPEE